MKPVRQTQLDPSALDSHFPRPLHGVSAAEGPVEVSFVNGIVQPSANGDRQTDGSGEKTVGNSAIIICHLMPGSI